jgi:hypothetical protein
MRFPKWAISDDRMKVKYLMMQMALEVDPNGRMAVLAKEADVGYETLLWAIRNNVSSVVAEKVSAAVPQCGVRPHWLTNPSWIKFDETTGEIFE